MEETFETGIGSFLDRFELTRRLEKMLEFSMEHHGLTLLPFGHPVLLAGNSWLQSKLKRVESKSSLVATMVKFTPDYLAFKDEEMDTLIFLDAKVSITPVFFQTQVLRIRQNCGDMTLTAHDIGEVEREAWLTYNKFLPSDRVAIVMAVPYHPRVLLGEWVANIRCMWCLKSRSASGPVPWNCDECPVFKSDGGFGVLVNTFAGGSGTPHTNIDLRSMRTLDTFLREELATDIDPEEYNSLVEFVKLWPLGKPQGSVSWGQYNGLIRKLQPQCPWLRQRIKDQFLSDDNGPLTMGF